ncbi:hypothetical protein NEOLEDRAFT_1241097 [Neolentinus lepideus HHB14362 ss-1]|uniref:Uncharacterized protein n=1 Tax=Neolentinus lepideus HHB14362 ss-1 TaxID=1314782 RepID=A0A165T6M4_9AGAM|nr:hypothetical protein NEOLEDRAFT_1241097 [Neolentinus lepideus HHB14362 ss-1]
MATDVSSQRQPEQQHTPLITEYSDSEDSDSATRVYFGPLQSPEKRFTADFARRKSLSGGVLKTPVRRSRLSLAQAVSGESHVEEGSAGGEQGEGSLAEAAVPERDGTPERDLSADEPSSVLAGKILRAHDNPSPPPVSVQEDEDDGDMPDGHRMAILGQVSRVLDFGGAADPSDVEQEQDQGAGLPEMLRQTDDDSLIRQDPPSSSRPLAAEDVLNTSAPDLISFDSFSVTPNTAAPTLLDIPAPTSSHPTVDDLLSASPLLPMSAITDATSAAASEVEAYLKQTTPPPGAASPNPVDSSVQTSVPANALTGIDAPSPQKSVPGPSRYHTPPPSGRTPAAAVAPEHQDVQSSEAEPAPRTPRRSSRPSTSPYKTPVHTSGSSRRTVPAFDPHLFRNQHVAYEHEEKIQAGGISVVVDTDALEKEKRARRRERESIVRGKKKKEVSTGLSHLSPTSTDLLAKLMPSPSRDVLPTAPPAGNESPIPAFLQRNPNDESETLPTILPRSCTPPDPPSDHCQQARPAQSAALRPANPQLLRPIDRTVPSSPMKLNASATPARRIPISQAVRQGLVSSEKAAQVPSSRRAQSSTVPVFSAPVFKRFQPDLGNPNRSPAKRLPGVEMPSPVKIPPPQFNLNTVRSAAPLRSRSVEAEDKAKQGRTIQRPGSAPVPDIAPHFDLKASSRPPRNPLPFPINPIPEEGESQMQGASQTKQPPASSPAKSALRQQSAGSRIPRIGSKPYARPPSSRLQNTRSAKEVPNVCSSQELHPDNRSNVDYVKVRPARLGASSSDGPTSSSDGPTLPSTPKQDKMRALKRILPMPETSSPSSMKRKWEDEHKGRLSPVVVVPKVAPGGFGSHHVPMPSPLRVLEASIQKSNTRNCEPKKPSLDPAPSSNRTAVDIKGKGKEQAAVPSAPPDADVPKVSPLNGKQPVTDANLSIHGSANSTKPLDETVGQDSGLRRTSRSRRPLNAEDVFGPTLASRSRQARRKALPSQSASTSVIGMTQTALRAVTNKNTQQNQKYLFIDIETEVVRKPGPRPESPTTKVKTAIQKQKDEQSQERADRAERRARRSEGSLDDGDMVDPNQSIEWDPSTKTEEHPKHQRGPGDEVDYVTPEKPEPPAKKARFDVSAEDKAAKRVKWDKGLHTLIYLDDPKPEHKGSGLTKGALAKSAKELRLDNLGNLLISADPLPGSSHEKVVVKKFVYDNDPEVTIVEDKPPPKTRSKKSKN